MTLQCCANHIHIDCALLCWATAVSSVILNWSETSAKNKQFTILSLWNHTIPNLFISATVPTMTDPGLQCIMTLSLVGCFWMFLTSAGLQITLHVAWQSNINNIGSKIPSWCCTNRKALLTSAYSFAAALGVTLGRFWPLSNSFSVFATSCSILSTHVVLVSLSIKLAVVTMLSSSLLLLLIGLLQDSKLIFWRFHSSQIWDKKLRFGQLSPCRPPFIPSHVWLQN